jgi:hypothetical protein
LKAVWTPKSLGQMESVEMGFAISIDEDASQKTIWVRQYIVFTPNNAII